MFNRRTLLICFCIALFISGLFFAWLLYSNTPDRLSCFPENRNVNCDVFGYFYNALQLMAVDLAEGTPGDNGFDGVCERYFDDFAKRADDYYLGFSGLPEINLSSDRYLCRDSYDELLVYYQYQIGNSGALCYDLANDPRQISRSYPVGFLCQE